MPTIEPRENGVTNNSSAFSDPEVVARYAEGPRRNVPGFEAMQRMTRLLIAERARQDARVLVLGAGGGLELKVFAEAHPGWTFDGVDPSADMLALASSTLGPHASRAQLHLGTIAAAPEGPFDAGCCLLTFHFIAIEERRRTLAEVRRRLEPGAPFVVAHLSIPGEQVERALWLSRYAAFLTSSGVEPDKAARGRDAVEAHTHILTPEQDETLLREAGFSHVSLFYTAFAFRGWVGYA
jgi:tRNA (cmo5U34)-methyltransferase